MPDYEKMYHILFHNVTDAIEKLKQAQQETEELYIQSADTPVLRIDPAPQDHDSQ